MLCDPTLSVEVANVATPLASSVPVPKVVAPSLNVTVPAGVPVPGAVALTVAVKVTLCPNTLGLDDDVSAVVVAACCTTCATAADVDVV